MWDVVSLLCSCFPGCCGPLVFLQLDVSYDISNRVKTAPEEKDYCSCMAEEK